MFTGERLKVVRKTLKLSQQTIAEALQINASAISQMESNKIKPSLDTLLLLTKTYKVNLHWLITGTGEMFDKPEISTTSERSTKLNQLQSILDAQLQEIIKTKQGLYDAEVYDIAVTGEIAAGLPVESYTDTVLDVVTVRRNMINGRTDDYVCLRVNGHSMEPEIRHNDVVLIRQSQDWEGLANKICAVRIDGSITLKQMTLDEKNKMIVLLSLNNEYQPIVINPEHHQDINLIGYLYFLFRRMQQG